MTERLADISARIEGIRQLGAVVNAMRGIAAARAQQARNQLTAVDGYAATIAAAIGRALALVPSRRPDGARRPTRPALVLFCAEQGFAGAFSERVLDAAGADLAASELFLVGTRGAAVAAERGVAARWTSAMPSHSLGIPKLADRIADALYAADRHRRDRPARRRLQPMAARPGHSCRTPPAVSPRTCRAFPGRRTPTRRCSNLAPETLLSELTADYMHAQLCNAALHAFAAENEARMEAMAAARNQIERQLAVAAGDAAARAAGRDHGGDHRACRRRDGEPAGPIPDRRAGLTPPTSSPARSARWTG